MKVLFLGDVVGRAGRDVVTNNASIIKNKLNVDFLIVNAENATNGAGLSAKHAENLLNSGVDCLTLGDHAFDQKDMIKYIEASKRVVRPLNFSKKTPGLGHKFYNIGSGKSILVVQLLGRVFMNRSFDDPFSAIDDILCKYKLGLNVTYIIVDIHAEATSEKMAMGHYLDGQVSLVVGTHTHVPTADAQILSNGSAYITDVGMCGDYDSVIGMEKQEPISRFTTGISKGRFTPANGKATICGVLTKLDSNGKAVNVRSLRIGGKLGDQTHLPKIGELN